MRKINYERLGDLHNVTKQTGASLGKQWDCYLPFLMLIFGNRIKTHPLAKIITRDRNAEDKSSAWLHTPLVSAALRLKQEGHGLRVSLCYMVKACPHNPKKELQY